MSNKLFQKVMGFLQQPAKSYAKEKSTDTAEAFKYMATLSIISAVLSGVVSLFTGVGALFVVPAIIAIYVMGLLAGVIIGLWLHLWAYIFGAKGGLHQTLKTVFYGSTPSYLLGWIPVISILFGLWSIYIQWIGLQKLHGMKGKQATLSILIAFIIPLLLAVALALLAYTFLNSYLSSYGIAEIPGL